MSMRSVCHAFLSFTSLTALGVMGCADARPAEDPDAPAVTSISKSSLVVGETLWLSGRNLKGGTDGQTRLHFRGVYTATDGSRSPVNLTITPVVESDADGKATARWARFGPFANPFRADGLPGAFEGQIVAEVQDAVGDVRVDGHPADFKVQVGASILIDALEPLDANCGAPALRGFPGLAYRLEAHTAGFTPVRWEYGVGNVDGEPGLTTWAHDADPTLPAGRDVLGDGPDEPLIFNPLDDAAQSYATGIRIAAYDAAGNVVETALPFTVHRPLEVSSDGKMRMAERYEPVPVSGCMQGSVQSRVTYSETHTEYRQRSVSVTISDTFADRNGVARNESWNEGISTGESHSHSETQSDSEAETVSRGQGVTYTQDAANNVAVSSTDGEHWAANLSQGETNESYQERTDRQYGDASASATVGVEVEGSVPLLASASGSVSTTAGVRTGAEQSQTSGARQGYTSDRGYSMGGTHSEGTTYGSTVAEGQSHSVTGDYSLSGSRTRDVGDTTARDESETWALANGTSESAAVTRGRSTAEEQTWSDSSSDSVTTSFSGFIPNGKAGMFYRQTTRWVRIADVRAFDLCGVASHVGELQFNEWTWAPDLALADDCTAAPPKSALPAATCDIPPCGG